MQDEALADIIRLAKEQGVHIVTAESLTAGRISGSLANVPGASGALNGGFNVYQDEMKAALLGVNPDLLKTFTAVSNPVAREMAKGALDKTNADILGAKKASNISIAVTGYAGGTGGLAPDSDAGLVYIAIGQHFGDAAEPKIDVYEHRFSGGREAVRTQTTDKALEYVFDILTHRSHFKP